ncbi:hypothetical protein [Campylobacter sp. RM12651]|uniref:hypothetical protein n=1 Tax=Campylobacter sp. RM12651 TaxID=1660079 RepID=UPI001EFAF92C|nr:hypothetical protein [Campylobacter sp. RM12651]ULO04560.1 hypothetical protein AVBRAN_a0078 [Campylobacter sp. RM12651]
MKFIIKSKNSKENILQAFQNPKHKEAISFLIDTIGLNNFRETFIKGQYCVFDEVMSKLKYITPKKGKEQHFKALLEPKLLLAHLDVLSVIAWIDLSTSFIKTKTLRPLHQLYYIKQELAMNITKEQKKELIFLNFQNIDPFNILEECVFLHNDKFVLTLKSDIFITPYVMNIIKISLEAIACIRPIQIQTQTLKKLCIKDNNFFKIMDYLVLTKEQINYVYSKSLESNKKTELRDFLKQDERYKSLENYESVLKICKALNIENNETNIITYLVNPEDDMLFNFNAEKVLEIYEILPLFKKAYTNKTQINNIFSNTGLILVDDWLNYAYNHIGEIDDFIFVLMNFCIGTDTKNICSLVVKLLENHKFSIVKALFRTPNIQLDKKEAILNICKDFGFNPAI